MWKKDLDFRDPKYTIFPALNWNTDEFSCAIGLASLRRLKETNLKRKIFVKNLLSLIKKYNIKSCKISNFHNGYAPFYLPVSYEKKVLKLSKEKFANALIHEGIPLGINYGCVVSTWDWAKKYLRNKFISKNAIKRRKHLFSFVS